MGFDGSRSETEETVRSEGREWIHSHICDCFAGPDSCATTCSYYYYGVSPQKKTFVRSIPVVSCSVCVILLATAIISSMPRMPAKCF